jgi:hypothetical protein
MSNYTAPFQLSGREYYFKWTLHTLTPIEISKEDL